MPGKNRVFYRKDPDAVVVQKDGKIVAQYDSGAALIETHIKGLLARDQRDTQSVRELMRRYRPTDSIKS